MEYELSELHNLDEADRLLNRGEEPEPPSDAETKARCLLPMLAISSVCTADTLAPPGRRYFREFSRSLGQREQLPSRAQFVLPVRFFVTPYRARTKRSWC